jgi:DNA-binding transcriptional MerR regulator
MTKDLQGKMYYSISEVAEMIGVVPYVLRFWEKEFPHLKPRKNRAGNRAYQPKDIERVSQIKKLLYDEGYTIEGARNFLKKDTKPVSSEQSPDKDKMLIREIRQDIDNLLKLFP